MYNYKVGDRRAEGGTLWFDWPARGCSALVAPVKTTPSRPVIISKHAAQVSGIVLSWVAATSAEGLDSIKLTENKTKGSPKKYTVRLVFVEPEATKARQRVFDVSIQGKVVLKGFDIFAKAGGNMKVLTKTFKHTVVDGDLLVGLKSKVEKTIISGVEIVAE